MKDPWAVKPVRENMPAAKPAGEAMAEKLLARLEVERVEDAELQVL